MKIFSFKICPFVQRVTATLETKSIDYEIEYISLRNKPQWFLDASPNGQVPILITDDNQVLFESDAIVENVPAIDSPIVPRSAKRTVHVRQCIDALFRQRSQQCPADLLL